MAFKIILFFWLYTRSPHFSGSQVPHGTTDRRRKKTQDPTGNKGRDKNIVIRLYI